MTVFRDDAATKEARRAWWRERRVVLPAIVVVLLLGLVLTWRSCRKPAASEADAGGIVVSVQVAKAERGTIANEIATIATLAARREATIMPKLSAQIAQMGLVKNRPVRAGDVIAVLESRDISAQRNEAAAAVQEAQTTLHSTANGAVPLTNAQDLKAVHDARGALDNAEKTYERRKTLFAEGGISKKDLEASQLAVTQAQNDLRLAESATTLHRGVTNPGDVTVAEAKARQAGQHLAGLEAQVGYTVIRAPFDGVITDQFQFQGDLANPNQKLVSVADASQLIAKMQLSEGTASTLKVGDSVKVIPDDLPNETFTGSISLVGRGADLLSRSVEVWVMVPNPGGRLRPNGVARVVIAAQPTPNSVIVPSSAVTLDATNGNSGTVMVVDDKLIAHEVHVTTGIRSGGRTQILKGLNGGETVVVEGNYGLPDGTKVAVPSPAPEGKAAPAAPETGEVIPQRLEAPSRLVWSPRQRTEGRSQKAEGRGQKLAAEQFAHGGKATSEKNRGLSAERDVSPGTRYGLHGFPNVARHTSLAGRSFCLLPSALCLRAAGAA